MSTYKDKHKRYYEANKEYLNKKGVIDRKLRKFSKGARIYQAELTPLQFKQLKAYQKKKGLSNGEFVWGLFDFYRNNVL